jgi:hypothetical protein
MAFKRNDLAKMEAIKKMTPLQLAEDAELKEKQQKISTKEKFELHRQQRDEFNQAEKQEQKERRVEKIKQAKASSKKKTDKEIQQAKTDQLMNTIAERASYYRANPHRFVEEFLGIHLKLFQKILIFAMMLYDYYYYIASRGQGKTFLVSLYAVVRCILYPGTKILAFSYTFKQGKEVVLKITDDFMQHSPLLCNEIKRTSTGINDCGVWFKNGSWIQVRVAGESSRGARSNIIIIDESRMVSQKIYDTIIRPMNAVSRQPGYLRKPEYQHLQEMNKEIFMTSAWYKASEMYEKVKTYVANSLDDNKKYFICDLPYELSIAEGLLMREQIENEMSEETFSDITFMMEREGLFYGSSEDALFNYNILSERRNLQDGFKPLDYYKETATQIPKKQANETRILSLDIALMASKKNKNDASCFIINQCMKTNEESYLSNISYVETQEGLVTEELGLLAMRYFYQYDCDYFAIDANGLGVGVADFIMTQDRFDPVYGCFYKAMSAINNDEINARCKTKDTTKCLYIIKANAKMNNDMCLSLRAAFQNGYINLLLSETDMEDKWSTKIKGYNKLSDRQKAMLSLTHYQTTFLIDELINLDHEIVNGLVKVKEKSGMRKDRYSSLEYNLYVVDQLRLKKKKQYTEKNDLVSRLPIRKGSRFSMLR